MAEDEALRALCRKLGVDLNGSDPLEAIAGEVRRRGWRIRNLVYRSGIGSRTRDGPGAEVVAALRSLEEELMDQVLQDEERDELEERTHPLDRPKAATPAIGAMAARNGDMRGFIIERRMCILVPATGVHEIDVAAAIRDAGVDVPGMVVTDDIKIRPAKLEFVDPKQPTGKERSRAVHTRALAAATKTRPTPKPKSASKAKAQLTCAKGCGQTFKLAGWKRRHEHACKGGSK